MRDLPELTASWIGFAYDVNQDFGTFAFRRVIHWDSSKSGSIWISADQRYNLSINGKFVGYGPQRGEPNHWFADPYDLREILVEGRNEILVLVWNFGWMAPMAQHSVRTGLMVQGIGDCAELSTPEGWEAAKIEGFEFAMMHEGTGEFYIDVGPGEIQRLDGEKPEWRIPHVICKAERKGFSKGSSPWALVPRSIPTFGFEDPVPPFRSLTRKNLQDGQWNARELPIRLESGEVALFDFGELLNAFPQVDLHSRERASASIYYAESLWNPDGTKGNRDDIASKEIRGIRDAVKVEGWETFQPNWWRSFRFLAIEAHEPITVESVKAIPTGYPYKVESRFFCTESWVSKLFDTSIRTLKLCAGETYFDCPYYEQLQYAGDARIQALCGYYLSRDRHLQRQAIDALHRSLNEEGFTASRHPSRQRQTIPPFSLWWVLMVYDAWMHDPEFDPKPFLPSCKTVLDSFAQLLHAPIQNWTLQSDREHWAFGDWCPEWRWGVPPEGNRAQMHQLTYLWAKAAMSQIHGQSTSYARPERADGEPTCEHAEALHRILQRVHGQPVDPWPPMGFDSMARATFYFQYYVHLAREPENYLHELIPWRQMMDMGLSTFAETPEPTRSDCHAWSAHPVMGLFRFVAGVESAAPGWQKARIAPRPSGLESFQAHIAHPNGDLVVDWDGSTFQIQSPVPFIFEWQNERREFDSGDHSLKVR